MATVMLRLVLRGDRQRPVDLLYVVLDPRIRKA